MAVEEATVREGAQEAVITPDKPLPLVVTKLSVGDVLTRLDAAARRGKLAGFAKREGADLFEVEAYAAPFDHVLVVRQVAGGDGTRLAFRMEMLRKLPAIMAVVIVFTVWPGLPLTHSMLVTYFSWYQYGSWITAAWYLPLTVLPLPWMLRGWLKKSREGAWESAKEQIQRIRGHVDGSITQG